MFNFNISDHTYDILKWAAAVVLPALAALYAALASILSWPLATEVPATIMAFVLFLGAFLQISATQYRLRTFRTQLDENHDGIPDYPFKMSGPVYETIKWIVRTALPALSVAYVALSNIWGWPASDVVVKVVAAVVIFLGTVLQISTTNYNAAKAERQLAVE